MLKLEAQPRQERGKALARLRKDGQMPAVSYGRVEEAAPITISQREFERVWKEAGESTVITLAASGSEHDALIYHVDVDPVSGTPRHADFYLLEKGRKVSVNVPLEFVGVSPAVKDLGANLVKVQHELEIEAKPADLPHSLDVDISVLVDLDEQSQILVKDIKLPEGVEALAEGDDVIALVEEVKEEVEEEPEAPDLSQIEVEQKGKGEEAAEGGDAGEEKGE